MTPAALVHRLAALAPVDPGAAVDLDAALERTESPVDSRALRAATLTVCTLTALVALPVALAAPAFSIAILALGLTAAATLLGFPRLLAAAERARADGDGPAFVCRAALGVALHGAPEAVIDVTRESPLGRDLARHVAAAHGDEATGWRRFRERVAERDPAFARSLALVDAAIDAPPAERDRLLDAAVAAARRATRDRFGEYAASLHGPVSGVYAFGVVLPLALVGVLPVLPRAGAAIPPVALALCYDAALPLALAAAGGWLLANRPLAVPAPSVPTDHAALPNTPARPLLVGPLAAIAGWMAVTTFAPSVAPVAGVGLGTGAALLTYSRPREAIRERHEAVLDGLPAATTAAATRLVAGAPPESALAAAGDGPGATGALFADAAARSRRLSLPPRDAVAGPYGVLPDDALTPVARTVDLVAAAADAGPRGGRVLRDYADARAGLYGLAADLRAELGHTTGTLRTTGRFFAPGIAGATVALAGHVHALGDLPGATAPSGHTGPMAAAPSTATPPTVGAHALSSGHLAVSTGVLALVVGAYVLWLAAGLPVLAAGLEGPLDRTAIAGEAGRGLLAASMVFPTVLLAARQLV